MRRYAIVGANHNPYGFHGRRRSISSKVSVMFKEWLCVQREVDLLSREPVSWSSPQRKIQLHSCAAWPRSSFPSDRSCAHWLGWIGLTFQNYQDWRCTESMDDFKEESKCKKNRHPLLRCDLLNECRRRLNPTQVELACQSNPADREPFQYKVRQGETLERRKMLNKSICFI